MTVAGGKLNVRKDPTTASSIVRVLENGEAVDIVKEMDEWCQIRDGYVMKKYLEEKEPDEKKAGTKKAPAKKAPAKKAQGK